MRLLLQSSAIALVMAAGCSAFQPLVTPNQVPQKASLDAATALPIDASMPLGSEEEESKVGVLMLNLGGPETGDDVEGEPKIGMHDSNSN